MKILVSITSTRPELDFQDAIRQIEDLGIEEIALFPTTLHFPERQELYDLLERSKIKKILFVHLRSDMEIKEVEYLNHCFGAEIFNVHSSNSHTPFKNDLGGFFNQTYVENQFHCFGNDDLKRFAGVCLDVSHLHDLTVTKSELAPYFFALFKNQPCLCGHISASGKEPRLGHDGKTFFSNHYYTDLSQFDYIRQYRDILPPLMALELENDIFEQAEAKEYIEKMLQA